MKELQKLKLFSDEWYAKMPARELEKDRQKLDSYVSLTFLDMGIKEVSDVN